jgi:hypothetical protein
MKLFEPQASLLRSPFFDLHNWVPAGQRLCVAFFGPPFLAKQKRWLAAGLPPAGNLTATKKIKTRPEQQQIKPPPSHCAYSMRFFKHTGLRAAWNMRAGLDTIFICAKQKAHWQFLASGLFLLPTNRDSVCFWITFYAVAVNRCRRLCRLLLPCLSIHPG